MVGKPELLVSPAARPSLFTISVPRTPGSRTGRNFKGKSDADTGSYMESESRTTPGFPNSGIAVGARGGRPIYHGR